MWALEATLGGGFGSACPLAVGKETTKEHAASVPEGLPPLQPS